MQRAVPRQRSGPRTVFPVWARLRAFAALLRPGQSPGPTEGVKRGVGPFVGRLCGPGVSAPGRGPVLPARQGMAGGDFRAIQPFDFSAG